MTFEPDGPSGRDDKDARPAGNVHGGRFQVPHRGGTRIEVGEAIHVGGDRPWMCAVKLMGRAREEAVEGEATQTLLVRMGRGATPEDARRAAIAQLTLVYGSPVEPPPSTLIAQKRSDPPPMLPSAGREPESAAPAEPSGWLARLLARLRR